jgi:hypothetical protein
MILEIPSNQNSSILESFTAKCSRSTLPFRFISTASTESLGRLLFQNIFESIEYNGVRLFARYEHKSIVSLAIVHPQSWESNVLGVSVFSLQVISCTNALNIDNVELIKTALESVRDKSTVALVTARCWTSDISLIHGFQRNGFLLMDTAVDVVYSSNAHKPQNVIDSSLPPDLKMRLATLEDQEELKNLAGVAFSGHFGRFHADPRLGNSLGTKVYQQWILSCLNGWADYVFLVEDLQTQKPVGFSAWKKPSSAEQSLGLALGHYSIGAVSPRYSGRGIFTKLTLAGMQALDSCQAIEGPTHIHNLAVQHGYQSLGWTIADSRHTLHAWIG